MTHLPGAVVKQNQLIAPCPFCNRSELESEKKPGKLLVVLNPNSYFNGYFRCLNRCIPGGFPIYFGKMAGIDPVEIPGFDPDAEPYVQNVTFPTVNIKNQIAAYVAAMGEEEFEYFKAFSVSEDVVREMDIGYNGRYLTYPYYQQDGNCYAARCMLPARWEDNFWHGNEDFFSRQFTLFNAPEIDRCENGALFIVEGENNLMALRELGYPGVAVPAAADLEYLEAERFSLLNHLFIVTVNTPEAHLSTRTLATRLGFKARIMKWPHNRERGYSICRMAEDRGKEFRSAVSSMIKAAKSFSPFSSPEKEHRIFISSLKKDQGKAFAGLSSGFHEMDEALGGIHGINIMGGQPKVGKSCFFMQVSTDMAGRRIPVIYYDFENGRQKIYTRTLSRLSKVTDAQMRLRQPDENMAKRLQASQRFFQDMLLHFRVVTDRKLTPEIMRRQIEFLQHETRKEDILVVVDSLHKLPFKNLSERRTGIDSWLRQMEAIRDEHNVSFLVISELSRGGEGKYSQTPDIAAFKGSGDIEYSADNAMILVPEWNVFNTESPAERESSLWLVASRENNPGKIATYTLDYPYWGFIETGLKE